MKIHKAFDITAHHVSVHTRSDLSASMRKHWKGRDKSNIGMQYFRFVDGGTVKASGYFERRDLFCVQWMGICNAFINPDGSVNLNVWDGVELDKIERVAIRAHCKAIFASEEHAEFIKHQLAFFAWIDANLSALDGKTVDEAIAALESAGF